MKMLTESLTDEFTTRADELRARVRSLYAESKQVEEVRFKTGTTSRSTADDAVDLPDNVAENAVRRQLYSEIGLLMLEIEETMDADGGLVATAPMESRDAENTMPLHPLAPLLRELSTLSEDLPLVYARAPSCPAPLPLTCGGGGGGSGGARLPLAAVWPYILAVDAVLRFAGVFVCMAALAVTVAPLAMLIQVMTVSLPHRPLPLARSLTHGPVGCRPVSLTNTMSHIPRSSTPTSPPSITACQLIPGPCRQRRRPAPRQRSHQPRPRPPHHCRRRRATSRPLPVTFSPQSTPHRCAHMESRPSLPRRFLSHTHSPHPFCAHSPIPCTPTSQRSSSAGWRTFSSPSLAYW